MRYTLTLKIPPITINLEPLSSTPKPRPNTSQKHISRLLDVINKTPHSSFLSISDACKRSGITNRATVKKYLRILVEQGVLEERNGDRGATEYRLLKFP